MNQPEVATLIRRGLATSHVVEDREIWGAGRISRHGNVHANIVGLAVIGKVGVEKATALFDKSLCEMSQEDGPATREIATIFGGNVETAEALIESHWSFGAEEIAAKLARNEFLVGT